MLWISKAQKCVLDYLSKHTIPDMNRRDKDASCSTPSKTVRMSRLSGYLQKTSKKRMNREGSHHCSLVKHCSMTIFRLWRELTLAIQLKDMEQATVSKTLVEDAQREQRRYMEERGQKHEPRFFQLQNGRWTPKLQYAFLVFKKKKTMCLIKIFRVPKDPEEATKAVQDWIFPSTSKPGSVSPSVSPEPE